MTNASGGDAARQPPRAESTVPTPLAVALGYIARGWSPVPIPFREKGPTLKGWQDLRVTAAEAPRLFNGAPMNIGLLMGPASDGLDDVDHDCAEARLLSDGYLPRTGCVFGRASSPRSHKLYRAAGIVRTVWADPDDKEMLLELRGDRHQTLAPGSTHPSGEAVVWHEDGEPAAGDAAKLEAACARLAAASMLLRCAPERGRHDLLLLLAGALVRAMGARDALAFLAPLAKAMLPDRADKAAAEVARMVAGAVEKLKADQPVPGWPRLAEALGDKRARALRKWLGIAESRPSSADASEQEDWRERLLRGDKGPRACEANVVAALRHAPELAGRLRFDEFGHAAERSAVPWDRREGWRAWTDADDTALAVWCQRQGVMVKPGTCAAAVQLVAADNPHHPVREYLDGLRWDGTPRLDTWLEVHLGARPTGEDEGARARGAAYLRQIGRKMLIQPVARVRRPGCKADHMAVLEGPQGALKSSALRVLARREEWFADEIGALGSKDAAQDLRGKWLIEIAELSAMKRVEVERIKAFASRQVDHYRPSYGRRSQDFGRECGFFGTTNADTYLPDTTGNRRFWPILVGRIDLATLRRDADQLWAEAVAAFDAGEAWWLAAGDEAAAAEVQADRHVVDVWTDDLLGWAGRRAEPFTISQALTAALMVPIERQDQTAMNRVAGALKANGWERFKQRVGGGLRWAYRRRTRGGGPPSGGAPPTAPHPASAGSGNQPGGSGNTLGGFGGTDATAAPTVESGNNRGENPQSGNSGNEKDQQNQLCSQCSQCSQSFVIGEDSEGRTEAPPGPTESPLRDSRGPVPGTREHREQPDPGAAKTEAPPDPPPPPMPAGTSRSLGKLLDERGFARARSMVAKGFSGLGLAAPPEPDGADGGRGHERHDRNDQTSLIDRIIDDPPDHPRTAYKAGSVISVMEPSAGSRGGGDATGSAASVASPPDAPDPDPPPPPKPPGKRRKTAASPAGEAPYDPNDPRQITVDEVLEAVRNGGTMEVPYRLVTDAEEARAAVAGLAGRGVPVGLDLETTGLDPLADRARLLQLAPIDGGPVLVVDLFRAGGLEALAGPLDALDGRAVAHNATFEMGFLLRAGCSPTLTPDCTLLANHVLTGRREGLADLAERHLGVALDKTLQKSGWAGELTEARLRYAALDAAAVVRLLPVLRAGLEERGSLRAYGLARDAQPAVVAMRLTGVPFDAVAQAVLIARLEAEDARLRPPLEEALAGRNPGSNPQIGGWLAWALGGEGSEAWRAWPKTGKRALSTTADHMAELAHLLPPDKARTVSGLLLPWRKVDKKLTTYGENLAARVRPDTGRVHAKFNLAGAVTGRMSSSEPNMQNIPREADFRGLFVAPEGRRLVVADYNQAELRVAALLAGDEAMLAAFREGRDLHRRTAAEILGKPPEAVTAGERQLAKATNFGLAFGQGARGLRDSAAREYDVAMTLEEATAHHAAWFRAYPRFGPWHRRIDKEARANGLLARTPAGRPRRWATDKKGVKGAYKITEALNMPVQGGMAEALLAALARLPRALAGLDATPVLVVHDEIVLEASGADAPEAARVLERCMIDGFTELFPDVPLAGLAGAKVGRSWADK